MCVHTCVYVEVGMAEVCTACWSQERPGHPSQATPALQHPEGTPLTLPLPPGFQMLTSAAWTTGAAMRAVSTPRAATSVSAHQGSGSTGTGRIAWVSGRGGLLRSECWSP